MIVNDACTMNIKNDATRSVIDTSRSVIDYSSVLLQIVSSFYVCHDDSNMFKAQATEVAIVLMILLKVVCMKITQLSNNR